MRIRSDILDFSAADVRAELAGFKEHTGAQWHIGGGEAQNFTVHKFLRPGILLVSFRSEIRVPNQLTGCSVLCFDDRSPRGFDLICYLAYTSQCLMAGLPKSYLAMLVIVRMSPRITSSRIG